MDLVETVISGPVVKMRYANDPDATKATEWVEFQVSIPHTEGPFLSEVRRAALERVRLLIGAELRQIPAQ